MARQDFQHEASLRDKVRAEPRAAEGHLKLGAWLVRSGRAAQAREAIQAALGQASRAAPLHHLLGLVLAGGGDYEAAQRHLARAAEQEPTRFTFLRDLALVQGAAGQPIASVETLRQAAALGGKAAVGLEWLLRLGERAAAEAGARHERRPPRPARRAVTVERMVAREPELAEALVARRSELSDDDRETLKAARRALLKLSATHPAYPDLHFGLSLVAEQLGEIDRAIEAAEKAIAINPNYAEACLLAVRLYEKSGRPEPAEQHCRRAAELRPHWLDAHLRLGRLLGGQGRPREAADAYRRALAIESKCQAAREGLAAVEAALVGEGAAQ
jgi:tetratricopeptide (TPR) repeat protein